MKEATWVSFQSEGLCMDEIELFRQIIASCDEALKDVFLRRMEASVRIARSKLSRGEPVYSAEHEQQLLDSMSAGLSPELQLKAQSLWKALLRMSRNRQYRVFLEMDDTLTLDHECDMVQGTIPGGACCCTSGLEDGVRHALGQQPTVIESTEAALEAVSQGQYAWCVVALSGVYKTDWLYDQLDRKKLYINRMVPEADGVLLAVVSPKLYYAPGEDGMVSAVFYMSSQSGSLASALSVLADNKQNMEFVHMQKHDSADDTHQFRLYVDFDGCLTSIDTRAAIYQLQTELPYFRVVGFRERIPN